VVVIALGLRGLAAAVPDAGTAAVGELPWRWTAAAGSDEHPEVPGPDGDRFRFTAPRWHAARLARIGAHGARWTFKIPGSTPDRARLVFDGQTLFAALYLDGASGCRVLALDARTGALRWDVRPKGVGAMLHSKYSNDVQLEMRDGRLVLYGKESAGRYIEVLSPTDGRTLSHRLVGR
jgi:hypothetical protein